MIDHKITPGLSIKYSRKEWRVKSFESSPAVEGVMEFLVSTPGIIGMILEASGKLLDPLLPEEYITVVKDLHIAHDAPSLLEEDINLEITVTKVDGNRIFLKIEGADAYGQVFKGTCERAIVMPGVLIDSAYQRASKKRGV